MKKRIISIFGIVLLILWMLVIFYFSSKSNSEINSSGSGLVQGLIQIFEGSKFNQYTLEQQKQVISDYTYFLSKTAHFVEYGILCFFCFLIFYRLKKYNIRYIICLIVCILFAISDEYHQSFSVGRTPRIQDVWIDIMGALAMILFIEFIVTIIHIVRIGKKND